DHTFDVFYQVAKDEDESQHYYQLYTLKNGLVEKLPLPKHNYIRGKFLNNFKAEIRMHPNKKPLQIDLQRNKNRYVQEDIYDEAGKLQQEKDINISPITYMQPILISESKGYGLKSYQNVKGIDSDDLFGQVETLWYYKDNEWIILKLNWLQI